MSPLKLGYYRKRVIPLSRILWHSLSERGQLPYWICHMGEVTWQRLEWPLAWCPRGTESCRQPREQAGNLVIGSSLIETSHDCHPASTLTIPWAMPSLLCP